MQKWNRVCPISFVDTEERRVFLYNPHTVEQYHIYSYLKEKFYLEYCLLSPLSRSSMLIEDMAGGKAAFGYENGAVREIALPPPPDPEQVKAFLKGFQALEPKPCLTDFEGITHWWLDHPNPLTYQQALGLTDDLYRHVLTYPLIDDKMARSIVAKGLVTEKEFFDIRLWYRNGHVMTCWLGQLGLDGTGNIYGLSFKYREPDEQKFEFYLLDDYYCFMNHITPAPSGNTDI